MAHPSLRGISRRTGCRARRRGYSGGPVFRAGTWCTSSETSDVLRREAELQQSPPLSRRAGPRGISPRPSDEAPGPRRASSAPRPPRRRPSQSSRSLSPGRWPRGCPPARSRGRASGPPRRCGVGLSPTEPVRQPQCTAPAAARTGSCSSSGTQSAVKQKMGRPFTLVTRPSESQGRGRSGRSGRRPSQGARACRAPASCTPRASRPCPRRRGAVVLDARSARSSRAAVGSRGSARRVRSSDTPPQRVVKAWFAVMTGAVM